MSDLVTPAEALLPCSLPDLEPSAEDLPGAAPGPEDLRVLVVDDSPVSLEAAALLLEELGARVDVAADGREALAALERTAYALVLMDLQLPGLDGYQTAAEIRRRERGGPRTRLVALTANTRACDRERALAAGLDDYLCKPVRMDTLAALLQRWLPTHPGPPPSVRRPAAGGGAGDGPLDPEVLEELRTFQRPGTPDFVATLVRQFLADLPRRVGALREGAARRDLSAVAAPAHALRSAAGLVGARPLAALCAELERLALAGGPLERLPELVVRFEAESHRARAALEALVQA